MSPFPSFLLLYMPGMIPFGMEYSFGQLGLTLPAVSSLASCACPAYTLMGQDEKQNTPQYCSAVTKHPDC